MDSSNPLGIQVLAGHDRLERNRKVFGVMAFAIKVSARDTGGALLVLEQANDYKGGPPRHLHLEQEEWFYVIEGEYTVEIGGEAHHLKPGDSVLAPRKVPHTWALTGPGAGRLLIAFSPAGDMEAFFDEATRLEGMPAPQEAARLFAAHGMQVVGLPLQVP